MAAAAAAAMKYKVQRNRAAAKYWNRAKEKRSWEQS